MKLYGSINQPNETVTWLLRSAMSTVRRWNADETVDNGKSGENVRESAKWWRKEEKKSENNEESSSLVRFVDRMQSFSLKRSAE